MQAKVETIKDFTTGNTIYPVTKANAVYLNDNITTVEGAINTINTNLTDALKVKTYTCTYSALTAGNNLNLAASAFNIETPSGYTPVAALRSTSGTSAVSVIGVSPAATGNTVALVLRNHSNSSASSTATLAILYAKNILL